MKKRMRFASGMFFARDSISSRVEQGHILLGHLVEVVLPLDAHGRDLDPVAVLPVAARGGDFAEVDLGLEVGGESIAVVAAVAVEDVDGVDGVELVLLGVGAVSPEPRPVGKPPSRAVRPVASSNFLRAHCQL